MRSVSAVLSMIIAIVLVCSQPLGKYLLKGKVLRIGLMGFGSRQENATLLLEALKEIMTN